MAGREGGLVSQTRRDLRGSGPETINAKGRERVGGRVRVGGRRAETRLGAGPGSGCIKAGEKVGPGCNKALGCIKAGKKVGPGCIKGLDASRAWMHQGSGCIKAGEKVEGEWRKRIGQRTVL